MEKAVHDKLGVEYYRFKEEVFGELDPHEIESWTKLGIWTPNLILDNTEDGVGDGEVEQVGIVAHESRPHILLYKSFTQTVCQTMDLHMFPYDQLVCPSCSTAATNTTAITMLCTPLLCVSADTQTTTPTGP